jgi:hypothetical protein
MGNVVQLRQPPRPPGIEAEFTTWAMKGRRWSRAQARRVYALAMVADRWLAQERETGLVWADTKDLQAYLFTCEPDRRVRNGIRDALQAFCEWLVTKDVTEKNPALDLPRL